MSQNLLEHVEEDRRNRGGMGVDPFRKALSPSWLPKRLMAGQPRDVDFDDSIQREFIEKLLDESLKGHSSASRSIAIDRPEMPDVQYETAWHQLCDKPKKMSDRYRARAKICERRHLQEKERRRPICPAALPIHHPLNRRNVGRHHLSAQPCIERRNIRTERIAHHLLHCTFMIQPETLYGIELQNHL